LRLNLRSCHRCSAALCFLSLLSKFNNSQKHPDDQVYELEQEVRRPDHQDAFESYYILKAKKEGKMLLNNDDGNVNLTMLLNLAL
jgi:hypothetical protein